jgi:hypothetical protein
MKTITVTLTEESFDDIVTYLSQARASTLMHAEQWAQSSNEDVQALAQGCYKDANDITGLIVALHTNRIFREE